MKIEDYGIIGDLHTIALVDRAGSMDWLCLPRFDSNACFAALLGEESNGCWKINPEGPFESRRRYRGDTLILETEFTTATGVARLIDFMPPKGTNRDVVRIVEGVSGTVEMSMRLILRFDYGKTVPWVRHIDTGGGMTAVAGPNAVVLRTSVQIRGEDLSTVATFRIAEGKRTHFVLTWYRSHEATPGSLPGLTTLADTEAFWNDWSARCTYRGPWREAVLRSLITLKALTYAPTGGIVAAGTTSLPEHIGGVRNWDYRYCWLRDATFTLYSFMKAGYTSEARAWSEWLLRAVAGDPSQLQIMYGVGGERTLPELELGHLRGYEDSRPVRIGNAAAEQFQLDVYGEVMDALHAARVAGVKIDGESWKLQRHLVDFVVRHWHEPDEGIWEVRGPRQHFVHSKVMAWVALDRAVKAVEQFGLPGDVAVWRETRARVHDDVCRHGFNEKVGAFTQHYGSDGLDASLLMMPLVGFLPATDPRIVATVERVAAELTDDGLVKRYRTKSGVDGLPPGEGTFLPCSFWMADCLYLAGRKDEAVAMFERLLALRNDLGLLAEEFDPVAKRQLGNVPQAFSHVCLVNTAENLTPKQLGPAEERSALGTNSPFPPG
ncbi:MAG TPA: glycoside hydrolase family 15 protein [Opitutaceae bacterium]|nr:glycoside hydrolase family 15 protein [Opitutaceae bacterium]